MRIGNRNPKIMLIGTGIAFIVSGIDCLENDLLFIAVLSFIVGALNIAACLFIKKHPFSIKIILLLINVVFAFLSSYIYAMAGRDKIQYGWAAVGAISIIAIIVAYYKRSKGKIKPDDSQVG